MARGFERPLDAASRGRAGRASGRRVRVRVAQQRAGRAPAAPSPSGEGCGVVARRCPASAGDDYVFSLDGGRLPDPARAISRRACAGRRASSTRRVRRSRRRAGARARGARALRASCRDLLARGHVRRGDPAPARPARARRDGDRADAGRDVPGQRGWGYDGVYLFAPHPAYGGPDGLARLVDAAHREGLGVILDVVYNHIGPGRGDRRLRAVLHRPARRPSGATRSTTTSAECASGRSRTPSCGCATTASTAFASTPSTRSTTMRRQHVLASCATA